MQPYFTHLFDLEIILFLRNKNSYSDEFLIIIRKIILL